MRHLPLITALLGGVSFALTAPPVDLHVGVFLGLGALFLALEPQPASSRPKRRAFFQAWLWATSAGVVGMRFVPAVVDRFTPLGMWGGALALVLLAAFQALGWGLGGLLSQALSERLQLDRRLAFPCGVLLACIWPGVFSWTPAALLSGWLPLVQAAELVGERGVSVVLAFAMACIAWPLRRYYVAENNHKENNPTPRSKGSVLVGVLSLAALWVYGTARLSSIDADRGPKLELFLIQPTTDARLRWEPAERARILQRLRELTREAERQGAELSVWPEAAYPFLLSQRAGQGPTGSRAIHRDGVRGPVLLGALTRAVDAEGQHNAATLIDASGHQQLPQAKLQLLWFGETIPLGGSLPWVRKAFFRAGGLVPGDRVSLLEHRSPSGVTARIAVLNCYEDILPSVGRRLARANPNLFVNLTNDAWFEGSIESELHLRLSVMRAIEARRDLVRAVNLGIPAWIDQTGRIRALGSPTPAGVLRVTPSLNEESPTLYVRAGDYPLFAAIGLGLLWLSFRRVSRKRRPLAS